MTVTLQSFSLLNPNPSSTSRFTKAATTPLALFSRRFHQFHGGAPVAVPKGLGSCGGSLSLHRRSLWCRPIVAAAASHDESKHPEVEVEKEKENAKVKAEESEEAWKQTLASFKEQALNLKSVSQEAYEIYSEKAFVILKETSEQLKIQGDKAMCDLTEVAKEISEEGKEFISTAAKNSPEPVKEIVETFQTSSDDLNDVTKIRDFHVGIPYGLVLSLGGILSFMVTGSTAAIRFGVILGGTLLALSISSLRSFKQGESFPLALKGQAAIASILFLREARLLTQRSWIPYLLTTFVSGGIVAFYVYRIVQSRKHQKDSSFE
ncbi:PREDICTED: uncharacterized protein LOC101315446 isoform X1 [Fragaria vesca subsp. vesca]|uniref:uncharacterized protein LOC101315446 isoform X1 n=1 Tax=Fragaria vesca subsp. vesca TaxID=101020 RepID=UPI0002C36853|nr:PREDICTED: uncharacterized protein LOC101315446 isoform X1 [Fragaria vesca subsp. vesca]